MAQITKTMKLLINPDDYQIAELEQVTKRYTEACDFVSQYAFEHRLPFRYMELHKQLYRIVRTEFGLKAQMAISVFKTVCARYNTVQEQLSNKPFRYKDEDGTWKSIPRTIDWLWKPISFCQPQADFVRNRDYAFVVDRKTGKHLISINTLNDRVRVSYHVPKCFEQYFDGTWSFGTGKVVSSKGKWYIHIPMTKEIPDEFDVENAKHIVGIDRGLRFLATTYDEKGKTSFIDGKKVMEKRNKFQQVRSELQARGTKSAKRVLKRISGRENRWMSDVNHQISKTLVDRYGSNTLFVVEDLTNVSFDESNLSDRSKQGRKDVRSWAFYQFEQDLIYKARAVGSDVLKVSAAYTSQRCPKCGRILKDNRNHTKHEYHCDCCGYRSNDDRVGAMNIQLLGTLFVSGDQNPRFGPRKVK